MKVKGLKYNNWCQDSVLYLYIRAGRHGRDRIKNFRFHRCQWANNSSVLTFENKAMTSKREP